MECRCLAAGIDDYTYNCRNQNNDPVQERKLYDNALSLLIDECSYALGKDKKDIEKTIFTYLEQ